MLKIIKKISKLNRSQIAKLVVLTVVLCTFSIFVINVVISTNLKSGLNIFGYSVNVKSVKTFFPLSLQLDSLTVTGSDFTIKNSDVRLKGFFPFVYNTMDISNLSMEYEKNKKTQEIAAESFGSLQKNDSYCSITSVVI